jgi:hypothetical protein
VAGLRGSDQIAAVADTGIDIYSCFFIDPQGHVNFSTTVNPIANDTFRKVIQYAKLIGAGDFTDSKGGHGTYVSSAFLGSNILANSGQ